MEPVRGSAIEITYIEWELLLSPCYLRYGTWENQRERTHTSISVIGGTRVILHFLTPAKHKILRLLKGGKCNIDDTRTAIG